MRRQLDVALLACAAALAGAGALAGPLHPGSGLPPPPHASRPAPPAGARYVEAERTVEDWLRDGYVEMVSPVRPPTSEDGRVRIVVLVRLPAAGAIRVVDGPTGETLELPIGTSAERLELLGAGDRDAAPSASWRVLDARGAELGAEGETFHVLRPTAPGGTTLLGLEWSRGEGADLRAGDALAALVQGGFVAGPTAPGERARAAETLRAINGCASCHAPSRPGRARVDDAGLVNRGTDARGFFQIASVFADRLPLETYRPVDANTGDPFMTRLCGDRVVTTSRCEDGRIEDGMLDVRAAVRAGDRHASRVCASRRAIAARLDHQTPRVARALAVCDGG